MIGLNRILVGDAHETLRKLPDGFVDCVVTSPPYFRLRNYQHDGQLGLEPHVEQWVEELRKVLRELHRVLVPTGTVWLNLGDSYSTGSEGAPAKSLLLGPERLALALIERRLDRPQQDHLGEAQPDAEPGREIGSPAPGRSSTCSCGSATTSSTSTRSASRTPAAGRTRRSRRAGRCRKRGEFRRAATAASTRSTPTGRVGHPLGKNPGDVWSLPTASYRGAHHAVFPVALAERPIKAGCPERRCRRCRLPWKRQTLRKLGHLAVRGELEPTCYCQAEWEPGVVLDPFIGSGTTAIAAEQHGRNWLGIELNPTFARLADERIETARDAA